MRSFFAVGSYFILAHSSMCGCHRQFYAPQNLHDNRFASRFDTWNVFGMGSPETAQNDWFVFVHLSRYPGWLDTVWMTLKRETDKQMFLFALVSPCHGRSGLEGRRVHVFRKQDSGSWYFINPFTHVLICTHYSATPVENHSTMWQVGPQTTHP